MPKIRAILSDVDGTLIEGGKLNHFSLDLKEAIKEARETGILFNLASGRPYFEQKQLYQLLIEPDIPDSNEGILYEGAGIILFGGSTNLLGGLSKEQREEIEQYLQQHNLVEGLTHQANNEKYETKTGYVTPTFISEFKTNAVLLEQQFQKIKPAVEKEFPFAEVSISADAVDIFAKGLTKGRQTINYSELTGIPLNQIAAIGDSGNDMPMLEVIGKARGLVIYVGNNSDQIETVRKYKRHFIPKHKGPKGAIEGLEYILKYNKKIGK